MNRCMQLGLLSLVFGLTLMTACQTGASRQPQVDFRLSSDYGARRVRDIAVLPMEGAAFASREARALSAIDLRRAIRRHLIDEKHYAVPKEEWVDEQLAGGSEPFTALNTDAILRVEVSTWDTSGYDSQNAIYVDSLLTLTAPDGTVLWSYSGRDERLALPIGGAGDPVLEVIRKASDLLVEHVFDTLPKKPVILVD